MFVLLIITVALAVLSENRVNSTAKYEVIEQQGVDDKSVMLDYGEKATAEN